MNCQMYNSFWCLAFNQTECPFRKCTYIVMEAYYQFSIISIISIMIFNTVLQYSIIGKLRACTLKHTSCIADLQLYTCTQIA